uniref:MHC class II alpha chain N-terminal domain-containing protein n=2 Tax=Anguilla anguilla TaxID=7936 RepID=A0A0E9Q434_ANGAN
MNHSIFTAVLLGAICVLFKAQAHIDIYLKACQTNDTAPEDEEQLDGDEMLYSDFKNKKVVITLPDFAQKFEAPGWYEHALANHVTCINNLNVAVQVEKDPPEEIDPPQSTIYSRRKLSWGRVTA